MQSIIDISNLEFRYPSRDKAVLKIPSFQIHKGEKVFLYGPSGTGKTTLLEIISGVLVANTGIVQVLGQNLGELTAAKRDAFRGTHLGYIFQSFNLIPYLTVRENIELPILLLPHKNLQRSDLKSNVEMLVDRLGIKDILDEPVTELSVGQSQRVAVARALLGRPELILADEPTSSLDFDHREKFIQLLFELCNQFEISLLFVSHDRSMEKLFSKSLSLAEINKASAQ